MNVIGLTVPSPEIRVDEYGRPVQQCPRCGEERVPSANGIREHDLACLGLLDDLHVRRWPNGLYTASVGRTGVGIEASDRQHATPRDAIADAIVQLTARMHGYER